MYPYLFEDASFLPVLGSRPTGDGVFSQENEAFRKRSLEWIFLENAVFMLSSGRVKTELRKMNAEARTSQNLTALRRLYLVSKKKPRKFIRNCGL